MTDPRLNTWKILFERALELIDSVAKSGTPLEDWSFGGGTVLMLRHSHRFSKDIDIFISDPQYLPYLTPRLNTTAEAMTGDYVEQGNFLKLQFKEGEIDFVASSPLTADPTKTVQMFERDVQIETSTEIVAKKVWHRSSAFKARDIFDLAMVIEREPAALTPMRPVLRDRRATVLARITAGEAQLRHDFAELEILDYTRSYDECVEIVTETLDKL
ncbi:MAG: nucleotidyl transferase AbiEii/AbiGii toxin family protein [Proteobacteria bacterium]|nr:nucleotidyl transferase AbiEii/AbiGii toxin family protein [Pseudomonadota bacterium]